MLKLSWNILLSKHSKFERAINVIPANSPVGVTDSTLHLLFAISPSFCNFIWS